MRQFFAEREVLEVSPPVLSKHTVTDPHIRSLVVESSSELMYLQTSPEYAMKKLLAGGSGPIYCLGQVFRAGETGLKHLPEFTMLEWYRPAMSLSDLQVEVTDLVRQLAALFDTEFPDAVTVTYQQLFEQVFGFNPHLAEDEKLKELANKYFPNLVEHIGFQDKGTRNDYLDLLFSQGIEPSLVTPHFVTEFPASQASLSETERRRISVDSNTISQEVSLRSELYWQGVELSNAYQELRDSSQLLSRMQRDNDVRKSRSLSMIEPDQDLLQAIEAMPPCVGVAVGVDRLLMLLMGEDDIAKVGYSL